MLDQSGGHVRGRHIMRLHRDWRRPGSVFSNGSSSPRIKINPHPRRIRHSTYMSVYNYIHVNIYIQMYTHTHWKCDLVVNPQARAYRSLRVKLRLGHHRLRKKHMFRILRPLWIDMRLYMKFIKTADSQEKLGNVRIKENLCENPNACSWLIRFSLGLRSLRGSEEYPWHFWLNEKLKSTLLR